MAIFRDNRDDRGLDWSLMQNGAINLYLRPEFLQEDAEWLRSRGYRLDGFNCTAWLTEESMHDALSTTLKFPHYYGRNLAALNDCLSDLEIPEESGRVLVFHRYDAFAAKFPKIAWHVVDIVEHQSRLMLLVGLRLFALVQSDDPMISFDSLGAQSANWNGREWFMKDRGL